MEDVVVVASVYKYNNIEFANPASKAECIGGVFPVGVLSGEMKVVLFIFILLTWDFQVLGLFIKHGFLWVHPQEGEGIWSWRNGVSE